jgi:hypothetical protein
VVWVNAVIGDAILHLYWIQTKALILGPEEDVLLKEGAAVVGELAGAVAESAVAERGEDVDNRSRIFLPQKKLKFFIRTADKNNARLSRKRQTS